MDFNFRLRDDWNNWRLFWASGDYTKQTAAGPVSRIAYVDYMTPLDLPSKLLDRHEIGAYNGAFAEEGSGILNQVGNEKGRYEVSYRFEGQDAADGGIGKVKEITAKDEWLAASTRLDQNPPSVSPITATDLSDLKSQITFNDNGNATQVVFSGGDIDPVTAVRKSYAVNYTWQQGMATSMRVNGLAYDSSNITPDHGFVSAAQDPNGLVSNFSFDTLGRVTVLDPPGSVEQPTRIIYPTLREMRVIRSSGNETDFLNVADNTQTFASQEYDGLGRVIKRKKAVPGKTDGTGRLAIQVVRYDQVGREIFVSEWMTQEDYDGAPKVTPRWSEPAWDRNGDGTVDAAQYWVDGVPMKDSRPWGKSTFYGVPATSDSSNPLAASPDGLGRVRRIVLADGSITDKTYCGPHEEETVRNVRVAVTGATQYVDVSNRYYRDDAGHLVAVDTPPLAGQSGSAVGADAIYDYDARGKLSKVTLYPSNALTSDPFQIWRVGPRPSGGQTREFSYNAVGRLIDSRHPEKGWERNRLYDAWGNLLAFQDQNGLDRGYLFHNEYDVAGRQIRSEKRAGQLTGSTITGGGDHSVLNETFDSDLDANWSEGWFDNGRFRVFGSLPAPAPQDGQWKTVGATSLTCIPPPPGTSSGKILYFGTSCSYSGALVDAEAVRHKLSGLHRDDTITLKLYRSTREGKTTSPDPHDEFMILVLPDSSADADADGTPDNVDYDQRRLVYSISEDQAVFPKWFKTPAIHPADFFADWGPAETRDVWVYIAFKKGGTTSENLGSGVAVDDLYVGRRNVELLTEQVWDEPICSVGTGGDACLWPVEPADRGNGQLTTVKSYQDGNLISTKTLVYRGLNGRPSGVRQRIDWTGLARPTVATDWLDFVTRVSYTERGLPADIMPAVVAGVTEERVYTHSYIRDLLMGVANQAAGARFFKASALGGIEYDAAGVPTKILFENDSTQVMGRDSMHRLSSITSTWPGSATPLLSTGSYLYDGAGNIAAIGNQQFAYDAAGRLTTAWMLPQASDPVAASNNVYHKIGYTFDAFGNILNQDMIQEAVTIPAGFEFILAYDSGTESNGSSNKNRIISTGFGYDSNGNSLRFKGKLQEPVGAAWDTRNRMRAFYAGDPTVHGSIVENYTYDANGYRIVKTDSSGQPVISIRTDKGDTLSEFIVKPQATNPQLTKDFIYGLDQLLVERTVTSTAPKMTTNSVLKTGSAYNFKLVDGAGQGSYAVDISASSGWRRELFGIHPDANGVFSIAETELSPDETNFIRVRVESPQASPYSAPVSLVYDTTVTSASANQIRTISVSRNGSDLILRWSLNQSNGKSTKLYFRRADGAATYVLTPQALPTTVTELTLNSQALASPCGGFYGTQFSVGVETGGSKESTLGSDRAGEQGTQDGCGNPQPPQPTPTITFANAYRHLDQIGSLRIETGDNGGPTAKVDFYPYGQGFASNIWGTRGSDDLFAGTERDSASGVDYALARYLSTYSARFLSADPMAMKLDKLRDPQAHNLLGYVGDSPLRFIDPAGEERYVLLVGDPGLGRHNAGSNFSRAAETRKSELEKQGHTADLARVSTISDINAALTSGPTIDGGAIYFGHGWEGVLYPGETSDPGTNVESSNVGELDGSNLGADAEVELNSCNSGAGGENSIAQQVADQLGVPTTGFDSPMSFSGSPDTRVTGSDARPPETGPIYMVPDKASSRVRRQPRTHESNPGQ